MHSNDNFKFLENNNYLNNDKHNIFHQKEVINMAKPIGKTPDFEGEDAIAVLKKNA